MNFNKKVLTHIIFNICILILFFLFYFVSINYDLIFNTIKAEKLSKFLGCVSIILIIYYILFWGNLVKSRFNLFSIFLLSFFLFTLGQPLLYIFNLEPSINLYEREPIQRIVLSQLYTMICLSSLYIGSLTILVKRNEKKISHEKIDYLIIFKKTGILLFFISFPFAIYYLYIRYNITANLGYGAFYNQDLPDNILVKLSEFISIYFVMSLILLMIGYKKSKNAFRIVSLIIILYVIINFLIGNRATPTGILIILLWFKTNILKSVSLKGNLTMIFLVVFLMFLYPIIGDLRNEGAIDISNIKVDEDEENFLVESIGIMGYSMFPLVKTMEIIPEMDSYHYGSSYIFSLTTIIPNLSSGKHIGAENASLGQWLKEKLKMSSGPGYSMPAEAYYNFGWFPTPIMMLYGVLFAFLLTLTKNDKENHIKLFVVFAFFYMNITAPRGQFLGMIRDIFYIILPLYLMLTIYKNKYLYRQTQNDIFKKYNI